MEAAAVRHLLTEYDGSPDKRCSLGIETSAGYTRTIASLARLREGNINHAICRKIRVYGNAQQATLTADNDTRQAGNRL
jgi:hypothetical protein